MRPRGPETPIPMYEDTRLRRDRPVGPLPLINQWTTLLYSRVICAPRSILYLRSSQDHTDLRGQLSQYYKARQPSSQTKTHSALPGNEIGQSWCPADLFDFQLPTTGTSQRPPIDPMQTHLSYDSLRGFSITSSSKQVYELML